MPDMKIENFVGTLDTFTFPNNPNVFDVASSSNHQITNIEYQKYHILITGGGLNPKSLVLTGHFNGDSRFTNYRDLAKHFGQTTRLKKLYFESDKFNLGIGKSIKRTHTGTRPFFIDYVFNFETITGIMFGDTLNTSGTNDGTSMTFVEEITGTVADGASDVDFDDDEGNSIKVPNSALTTGDKIIYFFVKMTDSGSGIFVTEYAWVGISQDSGTTTSDTENKLVDSGQNFESTVEAGDIAYNTSDNTFSTITRVDSNTTLSIDNDIFGNSDNYIIYRQTKKAQTTSGYGLLMLDTEKNITTVSTTNLTNVTKKFRDGYYD